MNFCGADSGQVIEGEPSIMSNLAKKTKTPAIVRTFHCGDCEKMDLSEQEEEEEEELLPPADGISSASSSSEDDHAEYKCGQASSRVKTLRQSVHPLRDALDSIQAAIEDIHDDERTMSGSFSTGSIHKTNSENKAFGDGRLLEEGPTLSLFSGTADLLNPLSDEWKGSSDDLQSNDIEKVVCPVLDKPVSSPSFEILMRRLEKGFKMSLTGGPELELMGNCNVRIYLGQGRSCLFVESAGTDQDQTSIADGNKDEINCWVELPLNDILQLEQGGTNKGPGGFTVVVSKEEDLVYYDFEAESAVDREILVTSIMLLLDHVHNTELTELWSGGTQDKPILCSPSLEPLSSACTMEHPILCSSSLEQERQQLSPRSRVLQVIQRIDSEDPEAKSVIHVEECSFAGSNVSPGGDWFNRDLPTNHGLKSYCTDDAEDTRLEFKPSASSTHLVLNPVNSTSVAPNSGWCSADSCAVTLNDIANTCIGIFELKQNEVSCALPAVNEQRVAVEEFIATALGTPSSVYAYLTEGDIWDVKQSAQNGQAGEAESVIRNRAGQLNAQATRLHRLRNEMTFAAVLKKSKERMNFVQTVHSFDDAYMQSRGSAKLRAATEAANRLHSSPLLQSVVQSMKLYEPNGASKGAEDDVLYYDSDPEDTRTQRARQEPRRMAAEIDLTEQHCSEENPKPALEGVGFENVGSQKRVSRKVDEDTIVDIVTAMNNERLILIWHPAQIKNAKYKSPFCVKVWIEAGVYLVDGTFLLPKLTWSKASLVEDPLKNNVGLEKLDLLDICRIRPCMAAVDRALHPFAQTSKSFSIETQSEKFIFQAQTTEERDRIVYGLKLVAARLASLLMLRDVRAAGEFFGAISNMVPGEAPVWTQGQDNNDESPPISLSGELEDI